MIGQSDQFVPADKRLYALRDVTATVESIPLICASILSKKVASGAHALVMDVKTGSGAFMDMLEEARELADGLKGVGKALGRPVRTLITDMSQPLGRTVGNALEVREAIDCLTGGGPPDLREITVELCAEMILLSRNEAPESGALDAARQSAAETLDNGAAMNRFLAMVAAQGGSVESVEEPNRLQIASQTDELNATGDGFITSMDCREIGMAALELGAGRRKTTDAVDHSVGLEMLARIGDRVQKGQPMVRVFHSGNGVPECKRRLSQAIIIAPEQPQILPVVLERH